MLDKPWIYGIPSEKQERYQPVTKCIPFCGPYSKPRGARGLGKHYHFRFDPKLALGSCEIGRIPWARVACTAMLDKPWISGIS